MGIFSSKKLKESESAPTEDPISKPVGGLTKPEWLEPEPSDLICCTFCSREIEK